MTTMQFIKSLKYELRENEKMALIQILDTVSYTHLTLPTKA